MSEPKNDPPSNEAQTRIEQAGAKLARALNWSDRPAPVQHPRATRSAEPNALPLTPLVDRMLQRLVRLLAVVVLIQLIAGLSLVPSPTKAVTLSKLASIVLFVGGFLGLPRSLFLPAIINFGLGLAASVLGGTTERAMFLLVLGMAVTWAFPGFMVVLLFTQVRQLPLPERILANGILSVSGLLTLGLLIRVAVLVSQHSR